MLCASQTVEWKRREGPATSIPLMESSDCPWGLWVTGWISGVRDRVTMRRAGKTASSRLFHNLAPVCLVDLRLRPGAFWGDWTRQWSLLSCWFNDFWAGLHIIQLHKNCMKKWFTGNNRLWHYMIQSNDHPGWPCQNLISRLWQEYSLSLGGQPSHHSVTTACALLAQKVALQMVTLILRPFRPSGKGLICLKSVHNVTRSWEPKKLFLQNVPNSQCCSSSLKNLLK